MRHALHQFNLRFGTLVLAVILLLVCAMPAAQAAEASGTCGPQLQWHFSGDTLTITGSGAMDDYIESTKSPWYEYRTDISRVILPDGLTSIGNLAFYGCTSLRSVSIPDSVREIGQYAFADCTGLTMLDLGSVVVIEDGAFSGCTALTSVRLPGTLTQLCFQAFYNCTSLTAVTVPLSVTQMGSACFAYCESLVRADIYAQIRRLPTWTFYGCSMLTDVRLPESVASAAEYAFYQCTSLSGVEFNGSAEAREQIREDIARDLGEDDGLLDVSGNGIGDTSSQTVFEETAGGFVSETIVTTETENASVSASVGAVFENGSFDQTQSSAQIDLTLENAQGWSEASATVADLAENAASVTIDAYIKDGSAVPAEVLEALAGSHATVSVHSASGADWQVDCTTLTEQENSAQTYDFAYTREAATAEQLELLGCTVGYQITFEADAVLNAVVRVKLPAEYARQSATLCQLERRNKLTQLQTVLIDDEGYAHFYLANVDADTTYLIGIAMPAAAQTESGTTAEPIIPETLYDEYGVTNVIRTLDYVTTGRTSSWGISIGQVTAIMIGAILILVITVGATMFALNKRKLKAGYIPDLDEE